MNEERGISCCFTGHRPMKLPWGMRESDERCLRLREWISEQIETLCVMGYKRFICGMALGCDTFFAEEVLALKKKYPDIILEAAIPCAGQSDKWNRAQKAKYKELIEQCDEVNVFQQAYTHDCMMNRNIYMVDKSSAMIACFDGRPGGTMSTIAYAQRQGLDLYVKDVGDYIIE